MRERGHVEQHRHHAAGFGGEAECFLGERIGQSRPIRRIGHDVFGARAQFLQEVDAGDAEAVLDEVGRDDLVASVHEYIGNGALAARRFPDRSLEPFDGKQCQRRFGWCRIELIG